MEKRRKNLRLRILEMYDKTGDFCDDMGITRVYLNMIITGKSNGSFKFWERAKSTLKVKDEDMEYIKKIEELENGKYQ